MYYSPSFSFSFSANSAKSASSGETSSQNVTFSVQPLVSSGFKHWYAMGPSVTLTAYGDDTTPRSTFVDWTANGTTVSGNVYTWNGTSDSVPSCVVRVQSMRLCSSLTGASAGRISSRWLNVVDTRD